MVQISKYTIAPFHIRHCIYVASSLEPNSRYRKHSVTEADQGIRASQYRRIINDQGIRASQYRRIINDQGIRASQYRRIINDQGIRASQYRRICDDQGIWASQYRRTCDGHSKPRAHKNSSDGWSRFYNGSNLTIQFPQKGNIEFIFYRNKSPAGTSRCIKSNPSLGTERQQHQWMRLATSFHPHHFFSISHVPSTYNSHHNTLGHKYPNILSGGTLDTPQVYSYSNYYNSPIK